jgi:hypothetical protein
MERASNLERKLFPNFLFSIFVPLEMRGKIEKKILVSKIKRANIMTTKMSLKNRS